MNGLPVAKVIIAMGGNDKTCSFCLYRDTIQHPTISAAATALTEMLRHRREMEDEGLLPGVIPNDALVTIVLSEPLEVYLADGFNPNAVPRGVEIIVFANGQTSPRLPGEEPGIHSFDLSDGLFICLPKEMLPFVDPHQCVVATTQRVATVTVHLCNISEIPHITRFLEQVLRQVEKFINSALNKVLSTAI